MGKSSPVKSEFISAEKSRNEVFSAGISSQGIDNAIREMSGFGLYLNYAKTPVIGVYRWAERQNMALLLEISQAEVFRPVHNLTRLIFFSGLVIVALFSFGLIAIRNRWRRRFDKNQGGHDATESKETSTEHSYEQGKRE